MKKFYFFIFVALATTFYGQKKSGEPSSISNMYERLKQKYTLNAFDSKLQPLDETNGSLQQNIINNETEYLNKLEVVSSPTVQWKAISSSINISGVLFSQSKPLQYNDNLNAVTFIHRKGSNSNTFPFNNSGSIMVRKTQNWGSTWDSTCIWSSDPNVSNAQLPQGGFYNPVGGTNINNAYFVGMGPATSCISGDYIGNWYASKQAGIANYNFTASAVPNATQLISNQPPYNPGLTKHDFSMHSFTSTDDGLVRSLAGRYTGKNINNKPIGFKGAAIIKGTFNAGIFTWTSDTIIPSTISSTLNSNNLWEHPLMAWNEAGTVGYVVFIGSSNTYSANNISPNRGWQPLIYKTINSGLSWQAINGIDFSVPSMSVILNRLQPVNTNSNLSIPFFNINEGIDAAVDLNNRLHLATTIIGTSSNHNDSLAFTWQYQSPKNYSWNHTPGKRPYIYDFIGDGVANWQVITVDSMSSEAMGDLPGTPGYNANPWTADPGNGNKKPVIDSRLQISRDISGQYFFYSWAESDTLFTPSQDKWNTLPNIKVRAILAQGGFTSTIMSPTEINLTTPTPSAMPSFTINSNISNKAFFHYMTPSAIYNDQGYISNICYTRFRLPFSVTNSNPVATLTENKNWISCPILEFAQLIICEGVNEKTHHDYNSIKLYPNPTNGILNINADSDSKIEIFDVFGRKLFVPFTFSAGKFELNVGFLPDGLYFANIIANGITDNIKFVIQH